MNDMSKQTSNFRCLTILAYISLGAGLVMLTYFVVLCLIKTSDLSFCHANEFFFKNLKENPGEFIGGTVGTLFTLTATFFLFITFKEQRKQFESTQNSEFYTRFETTYFNMLGMLEKVQTSINKNISESELYANQHNLVDYYNTLKADHTIDALREDSIKDINEALSREQLQSAEVLKAKQYYGEYFEKYVTKAGCNVGYFYRYIYNIVNFVYGQTAFRDEYDKEKYLNLLQAQLSDEELALLFYDAISKYGENKEGQQHFREMLDETHFLENIKPQVLLDKKHCFFYPKTAFKFMSRDELKKAKELVCC